jgi:hypothetical protein
MITAIELRTKRRVIIEPPPTSDQYDATTTLHVRLDETQQQGYEWPWTGLRCKLVDGARLVVKDDCVAFDGKHLLAQATHLFFSALFALALSLVLDTTNYSLLVNWAFLFIASALLSLIVNTWRQWHPAGRAIMVSDVAPLQELQLGCAGHLYLPQNIFSVHSEVRSTGGSLSFGQWQQPHRLHLTLRMSGHAVVDGRHSVVDALSVFTGVGTGCVKNIRAMESLSIVSMSALYRTPPVGEQSVKKATLVPSRYQIDLQYDERSCRVDIGASASRYGITLNGRPPQPFGAQQSDNENIFTALLFDTGVEIAPL